ncbi:MAG: nucleotide sugar dehydrogenase, partial [Acidimicrobiia bacterium]
MTENPTGSRLVVLGQGYVGLPLAVRAVEIGLDVVGFDVDDAISKRLAAGDSQVEDVAPSRLQAALDSGRYRPTSRPEDCAGFDIAVIAVPTPLKDGSPDLSHIEGAGATIGRRLRPGATVVLESTTYPGTTEELLVPILEEGSGLSAGADFHVGYSPERLEPGNLSHDLVSTPKLVSGIDSESLRVVQCFYSRLVDTTRPVASPKVAELAKLLENTFRHVNIALVNEMAMFANDLGIDVWDVIEAASTKPFGFMRFEPGPGVGGHCLPIDPSYLSWQVRRRLGQSFRFVELANDVNDNMPDYVVSRLTVAMNRRRQAVNGSRILLLGLAYKRNTSDAREAPATRIVQQLLTLDAELRVVDPYVDDRWLDPRVTRVELTADEIAAADAVVVVADHDAFDYDLV